MERRRVEQKVYKEQVAASEKQETAACPFHQSTSRLPSPVFELSGCLGTWSVAYSYVQLDVSSSAK